MSYASDRRSRFEELTSRELAAVIAIGWDLRAQIVRGWCLYCGRTRLSIGIKPHESVVAIALACSSTAQS